jgi:antitoxin component of MazEF toxin-antitoxin module
LAEKRSLFKIGNSLAVTLPFQYVKANNLKDKDQVEVTYNRENNTLTIKPCTKQKPPTEKPTVESKAQPQIDLNQVKVEAPSVVCYVCEEPTVNPRYVEGKPLCLKCFQELKKLKL